MNTNFENQLNGNANEATEVLDPNEVLPIIKETPKEAAPKGKSATRKKPVAVAENNAGETVVVGFKDLTILKDQNPRQEDNYGDIEGLANSIKENGVLVNLRGVRQENGKIAVIAGHRRFRALELLYKAGHKDIAVPVTLSDSINRENFLIETLITNSDQPFTAYETALSIKELIDRDEEGASLSVKELNTRAKELAPKLGVHDTYVVRMYKLASADPKFTKLVQKGVISGTLAAKIMQGKDGVAEFLADYEAGRFFKEGVVPENVKITWKDVKNTKDTTGGAGEEDGEAGGEDGSAAKPKANSLKELWFYLGEVPAAEVNAENVKTPAEIFNFLHKVKEDRISLRQIENFFGVKL